MSQFYPSIGQNNRGSASASVLPMNIQEWFPLRWAGWISLQSKRPSRVLSSTQFQSINSLVFSFLYGPTLTSTHDFWKNHSLTLQIFAGKVMSMLFSILSRFSIAFLPRTKCIFFFHSFSHYLQLFWSPKKQSLTLFLLFPHLFPMKWWSPYFMANRWGNNGNSDRLWKKKIHQM